MTAYPASFLHLAISLFLIAVLTACAGTLPPESMATSRPLSTRMSAKDGMAQVCVPAGEFLMGSADSDPSAYRDEMPQHTVYLDAFWIDKTEVTNAMFAKFVAETNYKTEAEKEGWGFTYNPPSKSWERPKGADWRHPRGPTSDINSQNDYPVAQVSWNDAAAYCEWVGRRLPTEAEWEKAARGTDGRSIRGVIWRLRETCLTLPTAI
jgi:sulfatase modifying factor 1